MSVELAQECIRKAYRGNQTSVYILAGFIFILIIAGIAFGALAIKVEVKWAWFEVFVVPVLGYLIKHFVKVNSNTSTILKNATGALKAANNQPRMARTIREEKESAKQRRG